MNDNKMYTVNITDENGNNVGQYCLGSNGKMIIKIKKGNLSIQNKNASLKVISQVVNGNGNITSANGDVNYITTL